MGTTCFSTIKDITENATPPKTTKSKNSHSSVQLEFKPKSPFENVPRHAEASQFLDLVILREVEFSVAF